MYCRNCNSKLKSELIDLNYSPPSNSYLKDCDNCEINYPLKVSFCKKCFLFQTSNNIDKKIFFNKDYAYFSSYSSSFLKQCNKLVKSLIKNYELNEKSLVMEIASNDGYLLNIFKANKINAIGIEPSLSVVKKSINKKIKVINDFFTYDLSKKLKNNYKSDVILALNVLAHVPNINDFVSGINNLIKPNGVIIFEFHHVLNLIKYSQFDNIYHEHYSYLSISFLKKFLNKHGLQIFNIEKIPSQGGSLRVYISRKKCNNFLVSKNVIKNLNDEKKYKLNSVNSFKKFKLQILKQRKKLLKILFQIKLNNLNVIAYGAAAKGNTLLNYFGIKKDLINYVVDKNKFKQGKFLPGSHLEIKGLKKIKEDKPDFIIILPWNLKKEIMEELKYVRKWNCKFIIPSTKVEII